MEKIKVEERSGDIIFKIKVKPSSPVNKVMGTYNNELLKMQIKSVPEKGQANKEIIKFLSKLFDKKKADIEITSGLKSRIKTVKINKTSRKQFLKILSGII